MNSWLLSNVVLIPMDGPRDQPLGDVRPGALRIENSTITAVGDLEPIPGERVADGEGRTVTPGFVQGHLHCTQTLFRGLADDLPLLPWLRERIWPLEHAHDPESTRISARLTVAELLRSGTTTVQTMESVRHAQIVAEEARRAGLTTITGNCLMDLPAEGVPEGMPMPLRESLARTDELRRAFADDERIEIAVQPRFVLSCSEELARAAAQFATDHGLRIHTHAAEHPDEVAAVRQHFGKDYIAVLADQGLLGPRTGLAHCVHTTERERNLLASNDVAVLHCPTTNLKLGSGFAPVHDYDARGLRIAIGADGAPCNNRLSMMTELRQAALLQNLAAGPGAWPAERALWTATRGGALALGIDDVGHLSPGCRADFLCWDLEQPFLGGSPAARIVYSADEQHLAAVYLGGELVAQYRTLVSMDPNELQAAADAALPAVLARAGLHR